MILVIDNYDSFTYNLVHYIGECDHEVLVKRNDEVTLSEIAQMNPDKIVISPGPCTPKEAGISVEVVKDSCVPLLGVCLGHQIIGQVFGSKIIQAKKLMHGKTSTIVSKRIGILKNLPIKFEATRYHSLIIDKKKFSKDLIITAETADGIIMGVQHRIYNIHGVQFHPESIKTKIGMKILKNFINYK